MQKKAKKCKSMQKSCYLTKKVLSNARNVLYNATNVIFKKPITLKCYGLSTALESNTKDIKVTALYTH